jgi:hypothetical protein
MKALNGIGRIDQLAYGWIIFEVRAEFVPVVTPGANH